MKAVKISHEGKMLSRAPSIAVVAYDPKQINGPSTWLQRLFPELVRRGFEVHAIFFMNSMKRCYVMDNLENAGIHCTAIQRRKYTEQNIVKLLKVLDIISPDIFIPNVCVSAYHAARWVRASGVPTIGIIRSDNTFHHELIDTFVDGKEEFCLTGIVCKSKFLGSIVEKRKKESQKLMVCSSGTVMPDKLATVPSGELKLVYTGRLIQLQKRVFDMIDGLNRVTTEIDGVSASLFGHDCENGRVIERIKELNRGNHLIYGGELGFEDIYDMLPEYHVFVLLSDHEGMSTALLEAMACGLVPVCTKTRSGSSELIIHNENGLIVKDRGDDLVRAVKRLKTEKGLWQRLSSAARDTIRQNHSISRNADLWQTFLQEMLESSGEKYRISLPYLQEIKLPALKDSYNGLARDDKRMPTLELISQSAFSDHVRHDYFSRPVQIMNNPEITDNCDVHVIRSAIKDCLYRYSRLFSGKLLDIGCGNMPYREYLLSLNQEIVEYIGLDFPAGKYADLIRPDLTWDGAIIPIKEDSVDCAIATEVLEHCPEPATVLAEICRVLKPDGILLVTTPFLWPLHDIPGDYYRYTRFSLENLLSNAGFKNIVIKPLGGWDASLAQMIGLWLKRAPMPPERRGEMREMLLPLYEKLLDNNRKFFRRGNIDSTVMAPGWCGIAQKGGD